MNYNTILIYIRDNTLIVLGVLVVLIAIFYLVFAELGGSDRTVSSSNTIEEVLVDAEEDEEGVSSRGGADDSNPVDALLKVSSTEDIVDVSTLSPKVASVVQPQPVSQPVSVAKPVVTQPVSSSLSLNQKALILDNIETQVSTIKNNIGLYSLTQEEEMIVLSTLQSLEIGVVQTRISLGISSPNDYQEARERLVQQIETELERIEAEIERIIEVEEEGTDVSVYDTGEEGVVQKPYMKTKKKNNYSISKNSIAAEEDWVTPSGAFHPSSGKHHFSF